MTWVKMVSDCLMNVMGMAIDSDSDGNGNKEDSGMMAIIIEWQG